MAVEKLKINYKTQK